MSRSDMRMQSLIEEAVLNSYKGRGPSGPLTASSFIAVWYRAQVSFRWSVGLWQLATWDSASNLCLCAAAARPYSGRVGLSLEGSVSSSWR